ncbi:glycosyltransferase family 2 protein [Streptomyces sp. RB6PN25]|uniref:Glycosyltransferase family 2 protein n=1 Tax=Streptomyces humicola TaxID=2953240 RepID=A0ABT1PRH5_9ACTN|nr:glycosyltransferase family 2 protein [Streptomyces humicola]MCQ4079555.1 glycosyltransferase family 2 protein [Streptomyces humicola]
MTIALSPRTRRRTPLLTPYPDETDTAAAEDFRREYGDDVTFAPVTVVMAAFNEEHTIGPVLRRIPASALGMPVSALVVVDGARDGTADAAREDGRAYVCDAAVNRGQGAALRLGYELARAGGARYIVTTDADGQYDIEELDRLLKPLVDGRADFVTGSRTLGRQETNDVMRRAGVHVFAGLVSLLTGHRVTDTSFGLRAMRAQVTAAVTLEQPQYQSSELLISTLARGFRVAELPMLMRVRAAGKSKKGNNVVYGARYCRVVLRTWWRERRLRAT